MPIFIFCFIYSIGFRPPDLNGKPVKYSKIINESRINFSHKNQNIVDYDNVDLRKPAFKIENRIQKIQRESIYKKGMNKPHHIEWSN